MLKEAVSELNKQNICENNQSPLPGNTVFVKYHAQEGGLTPTPC